MNKIIVIVAIHFLGFSLQAQPRHLTIESNHSSVGFEVYIAGGITVVTGNFRQYDLKLNLQDDDWSKASIDFTIDVKSIDTGIEARDEHLRTADFFDVDNHPTITFQSEKVILKSESEYIAVGAFTMHGVTKKINIPFTVTSQKGNTVGIKIETSINRIEYGVGADFQHSSIPNFLSDDIGVKIYFWTKRDKRLDKEASK